MLTIRYLRSGRRNAAFFRVVLTDKSKPAKSGFQKVLGWYNPHTKETSLNKEDILKYIGNGAIPSNSVAKLLIANKITHKSIKFVKDAPGKPKKKSEGAQAPKAPGSEEVAPEEAKSEQAPADQSATEESVKEQPEEVPAEKTQEETKGQEEKK